MQTSFQMNTKIALDTVGAEDSLKSFNRAMQTNVNAMKNGIAQANALGDAMGANKAKIDGLGNVMTTLENKIELLRNKQEGLDVTTKTGADQYLKLQTQIEKAESQVAKYSAQQESARQKNTYYTSGLAELQRGYNLTNQATEAHVARLEAEGRTLDATKVKLEGTKQGLESLTQQLKIQDSELQSSKSRLDETHSKYDTLKSTLSQLKAAGKENTSEYKAQEEQLARLKLELDKSNEAFLVQSARVEKTKTSMAEAQSEVGQLNRRIEEINPSPFKRLSNAIQETNEKGREHQSVFKAAFAANLVSNAVISGWARLTGSIGEATRAGMEYDKQQQKMVAVWTTLTGHRKDAQGMVDDVNKLSVATGQSAEQTDELEQKFYHLHSSKDEAHEMTKAMLNMADAVGLNGQQIDAVSQDMTNALSRGKASAGEINQITQYFPMYREELAKSKNVTVEQLNEIVKQGKVSADDMEKVFEKLGNVKYGKAAENMLSTMQGAERVIKARVPALIGAIEKPIMESKNPMYLAVSKWVSDPRTEAEFNKVGKAAANGINTITQAFSKAFNVKDSQKAMDNMVNGLAKGITSISNAVAAHAKDIKDFFEVFKETGSGTFKVLIETLKDLAPVIKLVGGAASEHPKAFAAMASSMIITSKASTLMNAALVPIAGTFRMIHGPFAAVNGLFKGFRGIEVAEDASKITKSWSKVGPAFRGAASGFSKGMNSFASGVEKMYFKVSGSLGQLVKGTGRAAADFGKNLVSMTKSATKTAILVGKSMASMALSVVKSLGRMAIAFATNPFGLAIIGITALVTAVVLAYAKIKPFRDFVNGLGRAIVKSFKAVVDFFKNNWKGIGLIIINPFVRIPKMLYDKVKPFRDFVNTVRNIIFSGFNAIGKFFVSFWNGTTKVFSSSLHFIENIWHVTWTSVANVGKSVWNGITSFLGGFWNGIRNVFNSSLHFVSSIWTNSWNAIFNIGRGIWNGITSFLGGFWNGVRNVFNSSLRFISIIWNNTWNAVFNFGKGIWNGISGVFNGFINGVRSVWDSVTHFLGKAWSDTWNGVINTAKSAVRTVGHVVADIANGVIKPINTMLDKIRDGINWILDKVGAHKIGKFEIPMVRYANGTPDTHKGGLAMVNDGPGSNFREMYKLPNGQVGMFPNKRNMIVPLPAGTSVLDGERSARMAKLMGIPAYKGGIGGFFSGLWDGAKDIVDDAEKIIKNPAKFMEATLDHFLGNFSSNIKLASEIITHFPGKLASESINWVKKLFTDFAGDGGGGRGAPSGHGVQRWRDQVVAALKANGLSSSEGMVNKVLRQIATESGGNEKAVQGAIGDINNITGDLAKGLMQVTGATFRANAFPGHNNPFNGYDSLLAGLNYAKKRYGKDLSFLGQGHGYANGGYVNQHQMIEIAEGNMGEFVIPTDPAKRPRAEQLMDEINAQFASDGASPHRNGNNGSGNGLEQEVQDLKNMVATLIKLQTDTVIASKDTADAVLKTAQDPRQRYIQDANNRSLRNYQLGG
ncbi:tape measure protein [Fructilactobacillus hinvesii]|uniref:Tape measure protein n=1 Tax=Fructilactobacillus hinvesii TaxID=2940300 RepID=A0ABY5BQS4_9LACO|nr:tape measure protein [Fructilactobacillus hinvesii]USS87460.1 tape measure protein [Fructilactobacillus hinvesii]